VSTDTITDGDSGIHEPAITFDGPVVIEDVSTTEERLERIIREADEEARYHATEAKRRRGIAKATRAALNILREGDES
jgi:vacuolar-type H+-ATPase subunit H